MIPAVNASGFAVTCQREVRRKRIVRAVLFIYILSLIEGPLRKWFLPGLAGPLTLLRDPFVVILYTYCAATGMIQMRGIARLWLSFAAVTSLIGLAQYAASGFGLQDWILGVRTYWLYMPIAFVIAHSFRREDIYAFLRLNMVIAVPYAFLVIQQYSAPPRAFINQGIGGDEDGSVGVVSGIVRPFGLFTYTAPNVQFTAAMIAFFVAFYLSGMRMRYRWLILTVSGMAVGAMSVLTGSRSIYFLAVIIIGLSLIGLLMVRPSRRTFSRILGVLGFVLLAGVLLVSVFPDMFDAMAIRFEIAERSEGAILNRAFGGLFTWVESLFTAPFWGFGIGAGAPGVARFIGIPTLIYGENDLQRNVNELGLILGVTMLSLRFGTAGWVLWLAYRLANRGVTMALPLAGFVFVLFFQGQITNSPISAFPVWLLLGLILAFNQLNRQTKENNNLRRGPPK